MDKKLSKFLKLTIKAKKNKYLGLFSEINSEWKLQKKLLLIKKEKNK